MDEIELPELHRENRPPRPGPRLPVKRLKAGEKLVATILSEALWGVYTHWCGDHSEPHLKDEQKCHGCKKGYPKRWKGYLHCYGHTPAGECLAELTPTSAHFLLNQWGNLTDLRGARLTLSRTKGGDKGRLNLEVQTGTYPPENLPPAKDPEPILRALWGFSNGNGKGGTPAFG